MSANKSSEFNTTEIFLGNSSEQPLKYTEDYSDILHFILTSVLRPPLMIFGIIGNLLNIIILCKYKARHTRAAIRLLIAMSAMDLTQLSVRIILIILEWIKSVTLIMATIAAYYRCYIKYVLQTGIIHLYSFIS